ncbi:MAG: PEP-CTERM sorting domain-containing protein [Acidobacteriales bacterium]|nr:PEP-CTERM sorting domain-containing protein [Terriglobales bacterium]
MKAWRVALFLSAAMMSAVATPFRPEGLCGYTAARALTSQQMERSALDSCTIDGELRKRISNAALDSGSQGGIGRSLYGEFMSSASLKGNESWREFAPDVPDRYVGLSEVEQERQAPVPTPEPGTFAFLGSGVLGLGTLLCRRCRS